MIENRLCEVDGSPVPCMVLQIFLQVCVGLFTMHEASFLYLDVKLENVLMKREGDKVVGKLTDVGLHRAFRKGCNYAVLHHQRGTQKYMAPELQSLPPVHCKGEARQITGKADVFSLCRVGLELMSGSTLDDCLHRLCSDNIEEACAPALPLPLVYITVPCTDEQFACSAARMHCHAVVHKRYTKCKCLWHLPCR